MINKYPKFSDIMRRKMAQQNLSVDTMAKALDSNRGSVTQWRMGYRLPEPRFLGGIADLLDAPILVQLAMEYRSGACDECGVPFVQHAKSGTPQRFCGDDCRSAYNNRIARQRVASTRADRIAQAIQQRMAAEKARDEAQDERRRALEAVAAFCRECEWDGLCKMPDCKLRSLSPLPLAREGAA